MTICIANAVSVAVNGDKGGKFRDFLDSMDAKKKIDIDEDLNSAKRAGLPIEDA